MAHALRTRADIDNIRQAYDRSSSWSEDRNGSRHAARPAQHRQSSAPSATKRPLMIHQAPVKQPPQPFFTDRRPQESPQGSVASLPSTTDSQDDCLAEVLSSTAESAQLSSPQSVPTTPHVFSALFPSDREILICHDDTTLDGNMNLRLDTEVSMPDEKVVSMTLFHLRMQDLKDRTFSLRRYCRDSGREVCHTTRKKTTLKDTQRPGLQRSLSNAMSSVRAISLPRRSLDLQMRRQDSGYGSMHSTDSGIDRSPVPSEHDSNNTSSSKIIRLEFSNYAQVDVTRRGPNFHRRYEFEYWGHQYCWQRETGAGTKAAFHLTRSDHRHVLGYIKPLELSWQERQDENAKGGWVPPTRMKIEDHELLRSQKDLSDVVVAAGLIALVDDAIREHFKTPKVEYIGPKRLIDELFRRESSIGLPARPWSSGRAS